MSKSKFIIEKFAKLFEQGIISYKDLSEEIVNIVKSQRDEIVLRMKISTKEETEVLKKRIETFKEELIQKCYHPKRLVYYLDKYNYDIGEE